MWAVQLLRLTYKRQIIRPSLCTSLIQIIALSFAGSGVAEPLKIHPLNPRYFSDGSGNVVYLTGSHTWANLQDKGTSNPPPTFEYKGYLDFLQHYNHNFIRLWTWEHSQNSNNVHFSPLPYLRTGPGTALDGELRFDLNHFNPDFFDRLRLRVMTARDRGLYVSVMLFRAGVP